MFAIIGIVIVIGAILGGYLMEKGPLLVLLQPSELLIIGGAAIGTLLIANPLGTVISLLKGMAGLISGSKYTQAYYLEGLKMLNDLFMFARKAGLPKLEGDIDDPEKSAVFTKYPKFLADHHAVAFVCDTLRMFISAGVDPFDLDQMMDLDLEVHHHEAGEPTAALTSMADSLPGLGIVAAVLGIVITMGALGGPPEEIGHKVASSLVGTFLGILLCYGFVGPIAANLTKVSEAQSRYYQFLRVGILAFMKGSSPITAVEFARRSIPSHLRPSFKEMEGACRGEKGAATAPAAAA
ncbi:MAG TPA: flagellar motor stator protein MotA [Bryobacteraceae bacterium]|jgi:chemotaxis protein MotA|nr:flagellar motor stator protein MotA [Bryobacteraceae bacterium]